MAPHDLCVRLNRTFKVAFLFGALRSVIQFQRCIADLFLPRGDKLGFFTRLKDDRGRHWLRKNQGGGCTKQSEANQKVHRCGRVIDLSIPSRSSVGQTETRWLRFTPALTVTSLPNGQNG